MQEKELKEEFYKKMVTLDGDYPIVDPHEKSAEDIADFWLSKIQEHFISKEEVRERIDRVFDTYPNNYQREETRVYYQTLKEVRALLLDNKEIK